MYIKSRQVFFDNFNRNVWMPRCWPLRSEMLLFTIALYYKYARVVLVLRDSFKTWICSVAGSNSMYLEIFRLFTIFAKKLFRVSAVSDLVFRTLPFSLILILSLMRYLSESKGFTDFQNSLLSVTFFIFKFS